MQFKTLNSKIEKTAYNINIQNIDTAHGHWNGEKQIVAYLDGVENYLYSTDKNEFNNNIVNHAITLMKDNYRIRDAAFYRIPSENKLILLVTSLVHRFKKPEIFSRAMTIAFNKHKFTFSIVELLEDEEKELLTGKVKMPAAWEKADDLNKRLELMRMIAFT
jgi:hypothetical protein